MRTRTDHIESLRRRVILAESEVAEEKENVRRGLEAIRWKDAQLKELRKRSSAMDKDIRRKDAHLKVARKRVKTKERYFDNCLAVVSSYCSFTSAQMCFTSLGKSPIPWQTELNRFLTDD
jgi:hypothetical protein